ncbi:Fur family transcriptional regulator [Marinitoga sp. 1135]|uniref:Fe2+/Zn2+ uptake regulation protein n=1 Tax=Marinitoga piezophila (strain DSM 14283 / JCM 11233 / KA3) TaxID=443254 RepID=H2J6T5_MARPK|nr:MULTISPECIES: Fur family transcriptional regulator [Marinitoga]AEX86366.1 Fe2+/Zn2+ uptake regulation protein [Marinitoga piezophila KA3]APT76761.1 Fur family transcriptional regulator [Marinitoga sp. 1137]NUU96531.1 Fur family transcriptional regulator [Marinitoga sp. 1135]NUU98462.1 Fur family transcriptional regulator [Marinitoga sp. 1138]
MSEQEKIEYISEVLRSHKISPSLQRIQVYKFLMENHIHPNVDTIYKELVVKIPTLSKTTVYNTLKLFQSKGIVSAITIDENEVRYDINTHLHGHFKCIKCGKIFDFDIHEIKIDSNLEKENKILDQQLYIKGICKECLAKEENTDE